MSSLTIYHNDIIGGLIIPSKHPFLHECLHTQIDISLINHYMQWWSMHARRKWLTLKTVKQISKLSLQQFLYGWHNISCSPTARKLSLAHCSLLWWWMRFLIILAIVWHGSFCMPMTWSSSQIPRKSESPRWRRGRLSWEVKGSISTLRGTFWCQVLGMMSSRNLAF